MATSPEHTSAAEYVVEVRKNIESSFAAVGQVFQKIQAPISPYPQVPTDDKTTAETGILKDIKKLGFEDLKTLLAVISGEAKGYENDDDLIQERLVQLLAKLPPNSKQGAMLTNAFINQLWDTLQHPPSTSLGSEYKYRAADGSCNNIRMPDLGKAGTPYARSAKPVILQNTALPDPGAIFDSLMAREGFEPHPLGISSMLFYWATLIIHDLFATDHEDFNISTTSSYLDLSPLYGSSEAEQKTIRTLKDGKLKPDCFCQKRILGFPPGVGVLVIMFNRMHNYIATNLASINENGRFTKPSDKLSPEKAEAAWAKYDNDLFQTARLVNCGLYVNIILKDYVRTILSLNRTSSTWDLDPRTTETKTLLATSAPEGVGNQVSAEFNLIYRWHSAISEKDDKWTQDEYARLFPGKDPKDVSLHELLKGLNQFEEALPEDPQERPFANLKRQEDGSFNDDDLVKILAESIEDVAGSFGANRVPPILRSVEILGIIQARSWNLATLNEFRQFFGLTKHTTFEDINPDPEVAKKLKDLYDHPDFVEMYPGLVAEKAKPPMVPGSGLCVNYTTSRAILSDAVTLVRGDRFYTTDYTAKSLTNWGFTEVQFDTSVDAGQVMYKLILRAFPNHFEGNSIYAHFPFVIPSENLKIHQSLNTDDLYSWTSPTRQPELIVFDDYKTCLEILNNQEWKVTWGESIEYCVSNKKKPETFYGKDFCLAGDGKANTESREMITKALYAGDWKKEVHTFFESKTKYYLQKYGYKTGSKTSSGATIMQVDIVRDIANLVNAEFIASVFSLPLKTEDNPKGIYTVQEMYTVLSVLFIAIFYDVDVANSFKVRNGARQLAQQLGQLVAFNVEAVGKGAGVLEAWLERWHEGGRGRLGDYGVHVVERLLGSGLPVEEVVWTHMLPASAAGVGNSSQLFSQTLDYYLGTGSQYLPELHKLAHENTPEADDKLLHYFMEGSRLSHTVGLYRRPTHDMDLPSSPTPTHIPASRKVLLNLSAASRDPSIFPSPEEVRLDRPMESYIHFGYGPHRCLGYDVAILSFNTMFKEIVGKTNLRRANGAANLGFGDGMLGGDVSGRVWGESQGVLKKVPAPFGYVQYMTADQSTYWPFPTTMKVLWDV